MKIKRILRALFWLLIGILISLGIFQYFRNASLSQIGWIVGIVTLIITLGILNTKFPAVARFLNWVGSTYLRFMFWYILFFLPFLVFRGLTEIVLTFLPPWLQVLVLTLWGLGLVVSIWILVFEKNRMRLFNWLREKIGTITPFAYSFNLMWIAIFFFSSVTFTLIQSGVLRWMGSVNQKITPGAIMDFYLWHFLDAVPGFKVTETLLWEEPLTYVNSWIGFLLLLFKFIVISPIIGAFLWYWRYIGKESADEKSKKNARIRAPRTYHPEPGALR